MPIILPPTTPTPGLDVSREMVLQRRNTEWFILADPMTLALTPRTEVRQPSGGTVLQDGTSRAAQTFRLIPQSSTATPARSSAAADAGQTRKYPYVLLGTWDAVVDVHDWWEDAGGRRWRVDQLEPFRGYCVRALVQEWGRRP